MIIFSKTSPPELVALCSMIGQEDFSEERWWNPKKLLIPCYELELM